LFYFPREDFRQTIKESTINPEWKIKEEVIEIKWKRPSEKIFNYKLDYLVNTKNTFKKINKKIKFPLNNIPNEYQKYTKPTEFIDINENIKQKATELAEGETDLFMVTFKLAEWVRENIEYDLNTLTAEAVQKSSWVLTNKEGVCDEITNLFISMVRAIGIPARFVGGRVYSNINYKFESHGWAEVYFPEYGWIPFDVTFGQYGWISPSHIKFAHSEDSGAPSVKYEWKSRGIDLKTKKVDVSVSIIDKIGKVEPLSIVNIRPLKNKVAPGSYVPLEAKIKNPYPYYIPLTINLISAPGVEDDSRKILLLTPSEERSIFWLMKIPKEIDEKFIYTSKIQIKTVFGRTDQAKIKYAKEYNFYSKEWAIEKIEELEKRQEKEFLGDIDNQCETDKEVYYSNEIMLINCTIRNSGNQNLKGIKFCIESECKTLDLKIAEQQKFEFTIQSKEEIKIIAETEEKVKESAITKKIIIYPEVKFDFTPTEINYREVKNFTLSITSNTQLQNAVLSFKKKTINLEKDSDKYGIVIEAKGTALVNGFDFSLKYKDELGKEYEKKEHISITVNKLPWYRRIISSFLQNKPKT